MEGVSTGPLKEDPLGFRSGGEVWGDGEIDGRGGSGEEDGVGVRTS